MNIVNFNRKDRTNTWKAWNKKYCQDLHNQTTSLFDYIIWNYPEYLIFNSPTSLSANSSFIAYKSLYDRNEEPRLVVDYEKVVEFKVSDDGGIQSVSLFFPGKLNYHQGFYNQSEHGDGILCYDAEHFYMSLSQLSYETEYTYYLFNGSKIQTINLTKSQWDTCKCYITNADIFNWSDKTTDKTVLFQYDETTSTMNLKEDQSNVKILVCVLQHRVVQDNNISYYTQTYYTQTANNRCYDTYYTQENVLYIGNTDDLFKIYKRVNNTWVEAVLDTDYMKIAFDDDGSYIYLSKSKDLSFLYMRNIYPDTIHTNFLSGYVCILNKLPVGRNNDYTNPIKVSLDSYLLVPIGNGGYYDFHWKNNDLECVYMNNKLNMFTNRLSINLAMNCRYYNPQVTDTFDNYGNITIDNLYNGAPHLTDMWRNLWSGQDELVGETVMSTGEPIFMDVEYSFYTTVKHNQYVSHFNAHTEHTRIKNAIAPQIWMY